jgi:histidinol-phosphate aminotransferase
MLTHYSRSFENHSKSVITERFAHTLGIPEENILLGSGCEDLLMQILQSFVAKGDEVLIAQYAWWYYKKIVSIVGGISVEFPIQKTDTSFFLDIQEVKKLVDKHRPKVVLIANPNNPTGDCVSIDDMEILVQSCPDSIFVLDESYWGYHENDNAHIQRFLASYPNAIILRTFSKYYGLPGIRIGIAIIHSIHSYLINTNKRYLGFNQLSEKIAIAALESSGHYETLNQLITQEKNRFYEELRPLPGVQVYNSSTNFVLISVTSAILSELKQQFIEAHILVRYFNDNGLENHFRVSIASPTINTLVFECIKKAVSRI